MNGIFRVEVNIARIIPMSTQIHALLHAHDLEDQCKTSRVVYNSILGVKGYEESVKEWIDNKTTE